MSPEQRKLRTRYWRSFFVALICAGAYVFLSWHELETELTKEWHALWQHAAQAAAEEPKASPECEQPFTETCRRLSEVNARIETLDEKVHPAPRIGVAFLQILTVISISFLSFYAFALSASLREEAPPAAMPLPAAANEPLPAAANEKASQSIRAKLERLVAGIRHRIPRTWPVLIACLPALLFVVAMLKAYQPAVFVMALVAIVVAAEHYSGLESQLHSLKKQTEELKHQHGALQKQAEEIATTAAELTKISARTDVLLNNEALKEFAQEVYRAYHDAKSICAVIRVHSIDDAWWKPDGKTPNSNTADSSDRWARYFALKDGFKQTPTLYGALSRGEGGPPLDAELVSYLPMPGSPDWKQKQQRHQLFEDIAGLAWELLVLWEVRKEGPKSTIRGRIARPLCWMHATDQKVFQVIQREPRHKSTVRAIAEVNENVDLQYELNRNLVEWAQNDIRRYADRGCDAEEYLFAVLRYAAIEAELNESAPLLSLDGADANETDAKLVTILKQLELEQWLKRGTGLPRRMDVPRDEARKCIIGLFEKLLRLKFAHLEDVSAGHPRVVRVRDLLSEVM